MQATATTPQPKNPRDKRQQKPKDGSHNTILPEELNAEVPIAQHSISPQSTSGLSQQMNGDMPLREDYTGEVTTPTTPSRPRSMYDSPSIHQKASKGQHSGNVSAIEGDGQRNRKAQKSQNRQSGSYIINSNLNGTPQPKDNRKPQTPGRSSATSSRAYAGPTFHASPAPSSLPMPKFLSKSVPEVKKAAGLIARLENEASEGALSPESSEGSPIREKAERFQQHMGEGSPLDIFFKADREEKARARQTSLRSPLLNGAEGGHLSTAAGATPGSLSPPLDHTRHHSRHTTNGSANGLFSMELEDERSISPATQAKRPTPPTDLKRAITAPSDIITEPGRDEAAKRNASSLALKKLLLTPQPQRPMPESKSVPTSEGRKRHTPPIKESSGPFAPAQAPPEIRILSRKQPASLPQLQKQFGPTPASGSSPRPRPPSSNLRQELSAPQTPVQSELPELPATPTPSNNSRLFAPPTPQSQHNGAQNIPFPSLRPTVSPGVGPPSIQDTSDVLRMEEELRRVLKMNVLGSEGATGVRS
jgi:hypothetical protein